MSGVTGKKRWIVIEYEPDMVVDEEKEYDLLNHLINLFNNARMRTKMTEYMRDPRK